MIRKLALSALALSLGTQAFAQGSAAPAPASGTSTAAAPAAPEQLRLIDRFTSSYVGIYEGTSILAPLATSQPSTTEKSSSTPIDVVNLFNIGYRLTPNVTLTPTASWLFAAKTEGGVETTLLDPYITLRINNVINSGMLNYATALRYFAPASTSSTNDRSLGALRSTHIVNIAPANSRFSLTLSGFAQVNSFAESSTRFTRLRLYGAPNLNFQISPTVSANVLYEALADWTAGRGGFTTTATDLEPGVSWDITPRISLNPYLDLKTSTGIKMETTSINASLSVRLL